MSPLRQVLYGVALLVVGDVRRLNVSEMNALGWYRA